MAMSAAPEALGAALPFARPPRRRSVSERAWAIAFLLPYAGVLLAFAVYPIAYGLWLGRDPALYDELFSDPLYLRTAINTALYVGIAVNLTMAAALLLSGFFLPRIRWRRLVLVAFLLPWALAAIPAFLAIHWMLIGDYGLIDAALWELFEIEGPQWLNDRWLALASNIVAYGWKWLPFWTVIFLAARMAIPREIHEAAEVDGAGRFRRFVHITWPLVANVYLVATLLATLWILGDFVAVEFVSGGAPARSSEVLATLSIHYAFDVARPTLGVATVLSALPVLLPVGVLLLRKVRTTEVQL